MKKYPESLQHRLASCNTSDNADVKLQWFKDITLGLTFLHGPKPPVLHGDLRCANIFLDDEGRCVLADFGLAFLIDASECTSTKAAGSSRWMAPEIMDPKSVQEHDPYHSFSAASDVFSLAMTAIEIFTGKPPFSKKSDGAAIMAVISGFRPDIPESITDNHSLAKVVRMCWDQNPNSRPSTSWVCYQLGLVSLSPVINSRISWLTDPAYIFLRLHQGMMNDSLSIGHVGCPLQS
ncbi:kinase-like protein [Coprinopsis marcescibilis]|uniref:Kinase-like protein n=1 Tax=Coprinopsis marcescibilis TaxID=230819 RepID=A0A5C3KND2_COPMA|nr:kinase-like protein [Coprinopsis marcescibilis]